ncbi:MAG: hypothetical protein ACE5QW_02685 [Thermoplasmata archaeon]
MQRSYGRLTLIVAGTPGVVLGLFLDLAVQIGAPLLSAGVLLCFVALLTRQQHDWSKTVNFCGEVLVAFGAVTVIGAGLDMWLRILS